ncbi:hypothetical protein K435DRAFT_375651 [Dendrothele bispora CBS 962.96]|uniref:Crinkler effector protein N-terminal domain-containing protein n=1 Tax=Dendrothele bispora (strain CBS 962.96) TaxID=1314807 RepID=A0A4S8MI64_DENBC|nr:hypothetical protein K435DRAFT_375651 [Dendrothele bispora CBS 962.96]
MDLTLFCYVVGSGEQACAVDILSSRTVAHLKEKIWEKMTITSKANQLLLFKASFPSGDDVAKQAKRAIEGFEPLDPTEKLSTIFSGEPPEKTVHIVAKLPDDISLSLETQLFKAYSIIDVDVDSFSSKPLCDEASVENYAKLYKDSDTGEEVNLIKEQVRKLEARRVVPALFCDPQLLHSAKERMSSETWNENYVDASSLGSEEKLYEMSKTELTTLLHMELELDNILNMQISKTLSSAIRETHFCSLFNLPVARARWNMPSPWEYQQ